jgi:lipid-A-disaccharide synthase
MTIGATAASSTPAAECTRARIFISTGEVSGDLQGSLLIEALRRQALQLGVDLEILALGGDRMAKAGATILGDTTRLGSVGLVESVPYIWPTIQVQRQAKAFLKANPPDLVVMIDYLAPNAGIGAFVRRQLPQTPTVYYIAPQEWVWSFGPANTRRIVSISDRLLAIFPGEAEYYQKHGATVSYVGHPLVDRVRSAPSRAEARHHLGIPDDQVAIALLPASRSQELKYLLPVMCETAQRLQDKLPLAHFWIPLSRPEFRQPIERAIQRYGLRATVSEEPSPTVIAAADLAIAKSGTVNLEVALMNVPQVVLYKVNRFTGWIAEHVLKFSIPFMSPPNLVLMEPIVPEFLQYYATPANLTQASLELLLNPERRQKMLDDYQRLRQAAGEPGVCDRVALEILGMLPSN